MPGTHLDFTHPEDTPAQAAARAWLHSYGITTKPYVHDGGDHPMMHTLPAAFEAFATAVTAQALMHHLGQTFEAAYAALRTRNTTTGRTEAAT